MSDGIERLDSDVARMVENHLIAMDSTATEVLPHFWMTSGFIAYDCHVPLATSDQTEQLGQPIPQRPLKAQPGQSRLTLVPAEPIHAYCTQPELKEVDVLRTSHSVQSSPRGFPHKLLGVLLGMVLFTGLVTPRAPAQAETPRPTDLYINPATFRTVFARDVATATTAIMAITQRPLSLAAFMGKSTTPAWQTIPTWYTVANKDRAIDPEAERFVASRASAHTIEVSSSRAVLVSHPSTVAGFIVTAANAVG
jgi:hypothetical protein